MKRLALILVAVALAACSQPVEEKAAPEPAARTVDRSIGPRGAAGISTALPMTQEAVTAAAYGYAVSPSEETVDGNKVQTFNLVLDGQVVFTIYPAADGAHIGKVVTRSNLAGTLFGDVVGATPYSQIAAAQRSECASTPSGSGSDFACGDGYSTFRRAFKIPDWYGGRRTPVEWVADDALSESTLVEMSWTAPPAS